ncbi:hypothetical protein [Amycolatopsis sp. GA6-003]|uniref:hypothetical protein n=1 Tax=Amycolatopsis sp. GA6-003 TaxID=2652444 RepID=UPI0039171CC4
MNILSSNKADAEVLLLNIRQLHASVEKTSSKAAAAILAKDYGSYSTREWVSGVVAYVAGFGALLWLAVYLVNTIAAISSNFSPTWQYVALKLGLTVTAAVAAGVAFQFGSNALSRAGTNKRVQLELGTIGTFLSDVGDEDKVEKAKLDFVDRTFGRAWEPASKRDAEKASDNGFNFTVPADKLVDMISKFKA